MYYNVYIDYFMCILVFSLVFFCNEGFFLGVGEGRKAGDV